MVGSRLAGRYAAEWEAVCVATPGEERKRMDRQDHAVLQQNIRLARDLAVKILKLQGKDVAGALIDFARARSDSPPLSLTSPRAGAVTFFGLAQLAIASLVMSATRQFRSFT